ncbi:hypothetical protein [Gordonia araii]|nr:hypothetical protein [Gordonia araii]NNG98297.1 hypothetical protein [Gordonia araii NBRC 100433]
MVEKEFRAESMAYSRLDKTGIAEVHRTGIVKLDIRSGEIPLASVGLERALLGATIGDPSGEELLLVMDGPSRREAVMTRTVMATVEAPTGSVGMVSFWQTAETGSAAFALLREGIARWGFSRERVEGWIRSIDAEPDPGGKTAISSGVGPAGLICQVSLNYKRIGRSVLTYDIYTSPDYRIPANIDSIRQTGYMDLGAVSRQQAETSRRAARPG